MNPFSILEARPIGVMEMLDQGERDDKVIAVHAHDPAYNKIKDISELPVHRLAEIRSFFEDYKKNENKVGKKAQGHACHGGSLPCLGRIGHACRDDGRICEEACLAAMEQSGMYCSAGTCNNLHN